MAETTEGSKPTEHGTNTIKNPVLTPANYHVDRVITPTNVEGILKARLKEASAAFVACTGSKEERSRLRLANEKALANLVLFRSLEDALGAAS